MIRGEIRNNQILELIQEVPGLNFRDIMRITGFKNGVLSYHINKLEKKDKVNVIRRAGNTRFFSIDVNEQDLDLLEMLRRPTPKEIILLLNRHPEGLSMYQIIQHCQKAQSTISVYLQLLLSKKIISIRLCGKKKIFVLRNTTRVQNVLQRYNFKPLEKTVQNFNDMFESL